MEKGAIFRDAFNSKQSRVLCPAFYSPSPSLPLSLSPSLPIIVQFKDTYTMGGCLCVFIQASDCHHLSLHISLHGPGLSFLFGWHHLYSIDMSPCCSAKACSMENKSTKFTQYGLKSRPTTKGTLSNQRANFAADKLICRMNKLHPRDKNQNVFEGTWTVTDSEVSGYSKQSILY